MTGIEDALGVNYVEKYKEAIKKTRMRRLTVEGETKNQIIELVKNELSKKPEDPHLIYKTNEFGKTLEYDVILAETPEQLEIQEFKFGPGAKYIKWKTEQITAFMPQELIEKLAPSQYYILVGKMNLKEGGNRRTVFYNFSTYGIITMQEIADYKPSQEKQEIDQKLEEHKKEEEETMDVKIKQNVPAFMGTDMKEYGPLEQGKTVSVPKKIGKILVERDLASFVMETKEVEVTQND